LQIGNVGERRRWLELEQKPADVRLKKPFPNVVGVVFMIDVLVMRPMFTCPEQHRVFKGARAENEREESHAPMRAKGKVGKQDGGSRG
jgi:hypothetical protein